MFNISQYLERFTRITPPDSEVRSCAEKVIQQQCGISVPQKNITVQNNILYIKTSPAVKSSVFVKKHILLAQIQEELGTRAVIDIR